MGDWIGALIDLGNNLATQYATDKRNQINREWQESMYERQLTDQRENWRIQNEYNLPINQRKRLEEAGINPNIAFGSSAATTAGSIGSGSVPSPTGHNTKIALGEFYLRKKQADAQIRQINASVNKENEMTEQLRLNNEMLSQLFADKLATEKGDMYVRRIAQGWQEDNLRHSLDVGLQNDEYKRDYNKLNRLFIQAQTTKENWAIEMLKQEYEHLKDKYSYEKFFYDMRANPYETSTLLGIFRSIFGPISQWLEYFGIK